MEEVEHLVMRCIRVAGERKMLMRLMREVAEWQSMIARVTTVLNYAYGNGGVGRSVERFGRSSLWLVLYYLSLHADPHLITTLDISDVAVVTSI